MVKLGLGGSLVCNSVGNGSRSGTMNSFNLLIVEAFVKDDDGENY